MGKLNKFRLFFSILLVILDIFLLPQILVLPLFIKDNILHTWSLTFFSIKYFKTAFPMWIWCQLFLVAALIYIWTEGKGFVNISDSDNPPAAGHGQHGTSRWMTQKEIEKVFTVKHF